MAIPGIPSNVVLQTANSQNFLSWSLTSGATSYSVQRSIDQLNYITVGTPTATNYLDTSVTIGTQYWYKVAAVNADGTSPYSVPQSVVPVPNGEMSLGQMRLYAQQRADRVNSNFVTTSEWNLYLNQSLFELYDILITQYGEEYFAAPVAQFNSTGNTQFYPLPDGITSFTGINGATFVAPAFYKLLGIDLGLNGQTSQPNNGWVTLKKFNFIDRNKYFYPNTQSTIYGVFNMSYRLFGNQVEFIPTPSANQPIRLWYIPRMTMLLQDTDITTSGVSGWIEYVIVDAAIKALAKEESDITVLAAQKGMLMQRIQSSSMNRDAGQADTISDTRSTTGQYGGYGPGNGFGGGW